MSDVWQDTIDFAETLRHDLHKNPELGWQENRTASQVRACLDELDIPWRACARTGTVAVLNSASDGTHIALRGDMDALPIHEQTDKHWQSEQPGCMHACGHDGHTATLMAAAGWLKYHENQLAGPVTLLFQPAEEGGHGAREMIADGALEGVDAIYGWHNWPAIPFGQMLCPDGIVMCGNGTFEITVQGQGGHASQPEYCRDPVLAGSAIVQNMQQLVSRRLPPQQAAVVSITSFEAPSAPTVIPDKATLGGSIRVVNRSMRDQVNGLIREIAEHTANTYGCSVETRIIPRYDATINHASQASVMRVYWQELFGENSLDHISAKPIMASEDFSYYLQEVPGAFALIGSDDGPEHQAPCHSPHYDFNDRLIAQVTRLFARLAGAPQPELTPLPTQARQRSVS